MILDVKFPFRDAAAIIYLTVDRRLLLSNMIVPLAGWPYRVDFMHIINKDREDIATAIVQWVINRPRVWWNFPWGWPIAVQASLMNCTQRLFLSDHVGRVPIGIHAVQTVIACAGLAGLVRLA